MSDYIERQAAIDAVGDIHPLDYNLQAIAYRLKSLPSADVEPVRHGRWIYGTDDETGEQDIVAWTCSLCGEKTPWQPRYCMNCGARMDGDDNAE